jgi:tmRNA-binding protein
MVYVHDCYLAIKNNEIILFAGKWMELENFMLSKVSQAQKIKGRVFPHMCKLETLQVNVYTDTYTIIYICMYIYMYTHTHGERKNKIV